MVKQICFKPTSFLVFVLICLLVISFTLYYTYTHSHSTQHFVNIKVPKNREVRNYPLAYPSEVSERIHPGRERDEFIRSQWRPKFADIPINIPTQGYDDGLYMRIGVLLHDTNENYRLPLWGKRQYPSSTYYDYYVIDHTLHENKIALDEQRELFDGDKVKVPGYPGSFQVYLNHDDQPRYFPNVIGSRGGPLPFKTHFGPSLHGFSDY